jgi:hypothetical protein
MDKKNVNFLIALGTVMVVIVLSYALGEFIVGKDARFGQIVIFLSIFLGMILYYTADSLSKKVLAK